MFFNFNCAYSVMHVVRRKQFPEMVSSVIDNFRYDSWKDFVCICSQSEVTYYSENS